MIALTLIHILLCLYLVGSVFCRAVLMDAHTVHADVRFVFWLLGAVALWGISAPLVAGWAPDLYMLTLEAAFCAVQRVTSRYWAGEVPPQFCRIVPRNRRSTDNEVTQ